MAPPSQWTTSSSTSSTTLAIIVGSSSSSSSSSVKPFSNPVWLCSPTPSSIVVIVVVVCLVLRSQFSLLSANSRATLPRSHLSRIPKPPHTYREDTGSEVRIQPTLRRGFARVCVRACLRQCACVLVCVCACVRDFFSGTKILIQPSSNRISSSSCVVVVVVAPVVIRHIQQTRVYREGEHISQFANRSEFASRRPRALSYANAHIPAAPGSPIPVCPRVIRAFASRRLAVNNVGVSDEVRVLAVE